MRAEKTNGIARWVAAAVLACSLGALLVIGLWRVGVAYAADDMGDGATELVAVPALTTAPTEATAKKGVDDVRLGMRLTGVDYDVMMDNNLLSDFGLYVASVEAGGPAARAGISAGDVIAKADGYDVVYLDDLDWVLESMKGRGSVLLEIESGRVFRTVEVELSDLASDHEGQEEHVARLLQSRGVRTARAVYPVGGGAGGGVGDGSVGAGGGLADGNGADAGDSGVGDGGAAADDGDSGGGAGTPIHLPVFAGDKTAVAVDAGDAEGGAVDGEDTAGSPVIVACVCGAVVVLGAVATALAIRRGRGAVDGVVEAGGIDEG